MAYSANTKKTIAQDQGDMRKSAVIQMIVDIAGELIRSKVAMDDRDRTFATEIIEQGNVEVLSLSIEKIACIIDLLSFSNNYSIEEIDDCIDFLQEHQKDK